MSEQSVSQARKLAKSRLLLGPSNQGKENFTKLNYKNDRKVDFAQESLTGVPQLECLN